MQSGTLSAVVPTAVSMVTRDHAAGVQLTFIDDETEDATELGMTRPAHRCDSCGTVVLPDSDAFSCFQCGTEIPETATACPQCGWTW